MARPKLMTDPVHYTTRLPRDLRDAFVLSCAQRDENAAAVIRRFLRSWLELNPAQVATNERDI